MAMQVLASTFAAVQGASGAVPTVMAHGMGDSCFNRGMKDITAYVGDTLGTYSVCIPTGNRLTDTTNGFFMTMNDNVRRIALALVHLAPIAADHLPPRTQLLDSCAPSGGRVCQAHQG